MDGYCNIFINIECLKDGISSAAACKLCGDVLELSVKNVNWGMAVMLKFRCQNPHYGVLKKQVTSPKLEQS